MGWAGGSGQLGQGIPGGRGDSVWHPLNLCMWVTWGSNGETVGGYGMLAECMELLRQPCEGRFLFSLFDRSRARLKEVTDLAPDSRA